MKIRVYSKILSQCMERCARLSFESTLWMSSKVRLALVESQLRLTVFTGTTWIDTLMNCEVGKRGDPILFDCDDLMSILRSLGDGTIRIESTEKSAQLSGDNKRSYRLPIHSKADDTSFEPPKVEGGVGVEIVATTLRDAVESVRFAAPTDTAHPGHCFVQLNFSDDEVAAYASEGHLFAHKKLACPGKRKDFTINIPALMSDPDGKSKRSNFLKTLIDLQSIDPIRITVTDKHIFVESDDTLICSVLPAVQPFDFVQVHKTNIVMPPPVCIVNTDNFRKAISAVCLLKERSAEEEKQSPPMVHVQLSGTVLTVSRTTTESYAEDTLEAEPAYADATLDCHLDPSWLRSVIGAVTSPTFTICTLADIMSPFGVVSDDDEKSFDCIIMKMRETH
jgi:DNA polymerase III sliding clamp (beta) subunit (PCNA family)